MNKKQIGWIINGVLTVGAVVTSIAFPNPAIIFPVVAGATTIGTLQSIFTVVETRGEKEERAGKRIIIASENQNDRASRERDNIGEKQYIRMATQEDSKSNPAPAKVYENLHSNPQQAKFSGNHRTYPANTNGGSNSIKQDDEMTL